MANDYEAYQYAGIFVSIKFLHLRCQRESILKCLQSDTDR